MKVIHDDEKITENSVIALGSFDGLHIAHISIIKNIVNYARENGLKSVVMLFEGNFKNVKQITDNASKIKILDKINPDYVYIRKFDKEFMELTPRQFVEYLIGNLSVKAICVGYDYTFGYKAQGTVDVLCRLGDEYGLKVIITEKQTYDNHVISSTYIRELIENGKVDKAQRMLGRYFFIEGDVEQGYQNGTKMAVPTANIGYSENNVLPKCGVYAGYTVIDGIRYKSVVNVGDNPTFNGDTITVESHILGFDGDLYGKRLTVEFVQYLREEMTFDGIDELRYQIKNDIEKAKAIL